MPIKAVETKSCIHTASRKVFENSNSTIRKIKDCFQILCTDDMNTWYHFSVLRMVVFPFSASARYPNGATPKIERVASMLSYLLKKCVLTYKKAVKRNRIFASVYICSVKVLKPSTMEIINSSFLPLTIYGKIYIQSNQN